MFHDAFTISAVREEVDCFYGSVCQVVGFAHRSPKEVFYTPYIVKKEVAIRDSVNNLIVFKRNAWNRLTPEILDSLRANYAGRGPLSIRQIAEGSGTDWLLSFAGLVLGTINLALEGWPPLHPDIYWWRFAACSPIDNLTARQSAKIQRAFGQHPILCADGLQADLHSIHLCIKQEFAAVKPSGQNADDWGWIRVDMAAGIVKFPYETQQYDAQPHHLRILEALIDAKGLFVTGPQMRALPQCAGKKIDREIKNLKRAVPPLENQLISEGPKGYRLVRD